MSDRLNYNTPAPAAMKALGGVHVSTRLATVAFFHGNVSN